MFSHHSRALLIHFAVVLAATFADLHEHFVNISHMPLCKCWKYRDLICKAGRGKILRFGWNILRSQQMLIGFDIIIIFGLGLENRILNDLICVVNEQVIFGL